MAYARITPVPSRVAQHGVGALDLTSGFGGLLVASAIGYGIYALFFKKKKAHARNGRRHRRNGKWSRAYKDKLPDSAFLYVSPGGHKERDGGKLVTVPRSKRHFPYKNLAGKVDLGHVRSAIGRIPRSSVPKSLKPKLQSRARSILSRAKAA